MSKTSGLSAGALLLGILLSALATPPTAQAADALVYKGPGSCDEGCSEAAALMATRAGLTPVFVGPAESDPRVFENAAVWIQPGGNAQQVADALTARLKRRLLDFVRAGGGYVGFCAGGYLATAHIGELSDKGLGLLPGRSYSIDPGADALMITLQAPGKRRSVYWEGGPAFEIARGDQVSEVTWTYPDGAAASVRSRYGAGKVYVTGLHPEAPQAWRDDYHLKDSDGLDYGLAVAMIRWAQWAR